MLLQVKVKPNSRASRLDSQDDGTWIAQVRAPPVDGRANAELISLVASHFGCRKADVAIKRGVTGRVKWVSVDRP